MHFSCYHSHKILCWQSNSHSCLLEPAAQAGTSSETHTSRSIDTWSPQPMLLTSSPFSASYKPWLCPTRALTRQRVKKQRIYAHARWQWITTGFGFFLIPCFSICLTSVCVWEPLSAVQLADPARFPPSSSSLCPVGLSHWPRKCSLSFCWRGHKSHIWLWVSCLEKTTGGQIIWILYLLQSSGDSLGHAEVRMGLSIPLPPF